MTLVALGINHNTAPVEVREAIAFTPEQLEPALKSACSQARMEEVVILSTCNRTELYGFYQGEKGHLLDWLAAFHEREGHELQDCHYYFSGSQAAQHMMSVASGLDSLVLGEPQILGQMKSAYALAREAGSIGSNLHSTFSKVFSVAKRVRSETAIGENPVSVAYAAVTLAQQIFSDLKNDTALLIGAGETIELVARHLHEHGLKKIIVANRTLGNAVSLAQKFSGEAILLADIPDELHRADIVISSTASQLPLLGKGSVEQALKKRKHKPMFMIDIAVPRDIEAQVGELSDVYLYTVDDLKQVIDENMKSREQAAIIAADIIENGVQAYERDLRLLDAVGTVKTFRQAVEEIRDIEVAKALKSLQTDTDTEAALRQLGRNLANKFMHKPTQALRNAAAKGEIQKINDFQSLFDLELSSSQPEDKKGSQKEDE